MSNSKLSKQGQVVSMYCRQARCQDLAAGGPNQ